MPSGRPCPPPAAAVAPPLVPVAVLPDSPPPKSSDRLLVVWAQRSSVALHLSMHSAAYYHGVTTFSDLWFVVGTHRGQAPDDPLSHIPVSLPERVHVVEVSAPDDEYPPLRKDVELFEALNVIGYDFELVTFADVDTYIVPSRLHRLLQSYDPAEPLYRGRPLHHCQCQPGSPTGANCTARDGVHYCSGAAMTLSRATLRRMKGRWRECVTARAGRKFTCRSSDSTIGWCLNVWGGIKCTPATAPAGVTAPPLGQSWAEPKNNVKQTKRTVFCQDRHHQGGVKERAVVGKPHGFSKVDLANCAVFHPVKRREHSLYLQHAAVGSPPAATVVEPAIVPHPVRAGAPGACKLAVGVLSTITPRGALARRAVRETYGKLSKALLGAVEIYFVLARKPGAPQRVLDGLWREREQHSDLVVFDFEDGYDKLFVKTTRFFVWAAENTQCGAILKTDDDTYLRLMPLLNFIEARAEKDPETGTAQLSKAYFGFHWAYKRKDGTWVHSKVVKDKKSAWYMHDQYPKDYFPLYMSGAGYGMSRDVARWLSGRIADVPTFRLEDAGVGIALSAFKGLRYLTGPEWDRQGRSVPCSVDTILDNPAFNKNFNFFAHYDRDMSGKFCTGLKTGLVAAGVAHQGDASIFARPA